MSGILGALGLVLGFALGWLALSHGPMAAGALALVLGGGLYALRGRIELVSERWPVTARLQEPPARVQMAPPDPDPLIDMAALPGGRFWMGSPSWDSGRYDDERPRHRVALSAFSMARTAVTRGLWRRVMEQAPEPWRRALPEKWGEGDDELPATHVSWYDAVAFCNALSVLSGHAPCYSERGGEWVCDWEAEGYRLPTEAEWEYACRGGRQSRWHWGNISLFARRYAWYSANSAYRLHAVGGKRPNRFGLQDIVGNCWEWCWDRYGSYDSGAVEYPRGPADGRQRVLRGGSFNFEPWSLRSALRFRFEPEDRFDYVGFRCVRSGAPAARILVPLSSWSWRSWTQRRWFGRER